MDEEYGLRLESVLGTSTDAQAQSSDIVRLHEVISRNKVPAVFVETTVNPKLIEQIASDHGISVGGKLYSDSLGDKDSPGSTYIDMLRYNTYVIVEALSKPMSSNDQELSGTSKDLNPVYLIVPVVLLLAILFVVFRKNRTT